jgi:hypothetical protein
VSNLTAIQRIAHRITLNPGESVAIHTREGLLYVHDNPGPAPEQTDESVMDDIRGRVGVTVESEHALYFLRGGDLG